MTALTRFHTLASEVRTKLTAAKEGADQLTRTEIAGLLATLDHYERITASGHFAEADAESALIRFGRNGYGPLIDGLVAQAERRGGALDRRDAA